MGFQQIHVFFTLLSLPLPLLLTGVAGLVYCLRVKKKKKIIWIFILLVIVGAYYWGDSIEAHNYLVNDRKSGEAFLSSPPFSIYAPVSPAVNITEVFSDKNEFTRQRVLMDVGKNKIVEFEIDSSYQPPQQCWAYGYSEFPRSGNIDSCGLIGETPRKRKVFSTSYPQYLIFNIDRTLIQVEDIEGLRFEPRKLNSFIDSFEEQSVNQREQLSTQYALSYKQKLQSSGFPPSAEKCCPWVWW